MAVNLRSIVFVKVRMSSLRTRILINYQPIVVNKKEIEISNTAGRETPFRCTYKCTSDASLVRIQQPSLISARRCGISSDSPLMRIICTVLALARKSPLMPGGNAYSLFEFGSCWLSRVSACLRYFVLWAPTRSLNYEIVNRCHSWTRYSDALT